MVQNKLKHNLPAIKYDTKNINTATRKLSFKKLNTIEWKHALDAFYAIQAEKKVSLLYSSQRLLSLALCHSPHCNRMTPMLTAISASAPLQYTPAPYEVMSRQFSPVTAAAVDWRPAEPKTSSGIGNTSSSPSLTSSSFPAHDCDTVHTPCVLYCIRVWFYRSNKSGYIDLGRLQYTVKLCQTLTSVFKLLTIFFLEKIRK